MQKITLTVQAITIPNITQKTVAILGQKGAGKSTLAGLMGRHLKTKVFIIDPVGSKPMQSRQFQKLIVTGGYTPKVEKFLTESNKVLIDISGLSTPEQVEWCDNLFLKNWDDMIIIVDEVHFISPQLGGAKSEQFLRFVKTCRNFNTGIIVTSQRPQSVSKEVLALCDVYIIGRVIYPLDRKICVDLIEPFYTKDDLKVKEREMQDKKYLEFLVIDYGNE